jgi:IS4 transposase
LGRPLVHIIDREGDSVDHYRQWQDHHFLVRAKGGQRVAWAGQNIALAAVAGALPAPLVWCREVQWHDQRAGQYVGETRVELTRPARQKRTGQKPLTVAGPPVGLRLIVSEVRAASGKVLAQRFLLSNVSASVSAGVLALWYYWRWRIETFFKLLKSAGQPVEQWQQRSAAAVARRLLVASAALVLVWQLARADSPAAAALRTVPMRWSGRQMKRGHPWTMPALLAGVWVLLAMLDLLEHQDLSQLRELAAQLFKPAAQKRPQHV